jgi:myosin-1
MKYSLFVCAVFEDNGFEQFCINYVNEKLQQCFIQLTLEAEQAEYQSEGIVWEPIQYFDNQGVCSLIDGKPGLLVLMDEVAKFKAADHEALLHAYVRNLSTDEFFVPPTSYTRASAVHSGETFGVRHYAGTVEYHAAKFLEKNADTLFMDIVTAASHSQHTLLRELFSTEIADLAEGSSRTPESLGRQFKSQASRSL